MVQKYFESAEAEQTDELSQEISAALATEVKEEFRYVTLRAESCCGCGCSEYKVRRKVPMDSDLQGDDYIGSGVEADDVTL